MHVVKGISTIYEDHFSIKIRLFSDPKLKSQEIILNFDNKKL